MRLAPDTNILVYAEGLHDAIKQKAALDLLDALPRSAVALPAQVAAELFQVLAQRAQRTPAQARSAMLTWCDAFDIVETPHSVLLGAAELAATHRLSFWDGLVIASAAEAGCRLLLSDDRHAGFTWSSVTIANPFTTPRHPLLDTLLDAQPESLRRLSLPNSPNRSFRAKRPNLSSHRSPSPLCFSPTLC